jgi:D-xylose transport system ATP-binding protein
MAAQVRTTDVTHAQVVELITAGRSGNLGLPAENGTAEYIDITPDGDKA